MTPPTDPNDWPLADDHVGGILICHGCEGVHFNLCTPLPFTDVWMACCEGCGAIYDLLPNGDAVPHQPSPPVTET